MSFTSTDFPGFKDQVFQDYPLAAHTTWHMGGNAKYFCEVPGKAMLLTCLENARTKRITCVHFRCWF